jgi:alpha-beta hydrolase superfamily lysophospholipase
MGYDDTSRPATLVAEDGYLLHYRVWPVSDAAPKGTLILFNGMMSHAGWFEPIAAPLARAGYHVVGADRRGTGRNELARGDAPNAATLIADARAIIEAEYRDPALPLVLIGWCWGAVLAVNVALELPELRGLVLLAPGLYPTKALKDAMASTIAAHPRAAEDEAVLQSPIAEDVFTTGPALAELIVRDRLRLQKLSPRFVQISGRMTMNAAMRLGWVLVPMLLLLASKDKATDNEATLRAFEKLRAGAAVIKTLDAPHGIQFERAQEITTAILEHVARL